MCFVNGFHSFDLPQPLLFAHLWEASGAGKWWRPVREIPDLKAALQKPIGFHRFQVLNFQNFSIFLTPSILYSPHLSGEEQLYQRTEKKYPTDTSVSSTFFILIRLCRAFHNPGSRWYERDEWESLSQMRKSKLMLMQCHRGMMANDKLKDCWSQCLFISTSPHNVIYQAATTVNEFSLTLHATLAPWSMI